MQTFQLSTRYEPHEVEARWYAFWIERGYFHADASSDRPPFSIVIPPPNVTGVLHMGHALNNTLQDILCRWRRMAGDEVLWMPGTDHAGIATQNVVERQLAEEGVSRHDLGREEFVRRVWKWREESGGAIIQQLRKLGASCDWQRERFTMDDGLSLAVREVFVSLYHEGLIYRGLYIINWCPRCQTALSDLEVEHEEIAGKLYHVRYPMASTEERGGGAIEIATTRPETMFGDSAVAVHPEDDRYTSWHGRRVQLPLTDRTLPVILDDYVDREFGTGALKITPAHDPNDFEIGLRHELEQVVAIDADGVMTAAGPYEGMDRFACRAKVAEDLRAQDYLLREEDYRHAVGLCYRCKTVIEPRISLQWFVRTKELAAEAMKAVEDGRIKIVPQNWAATYFEWMRNIRDWCISRQIWWGHQIPVWTCSGCGEVIVAVETPTGCSACQSAELVQESDVLDTWFSSALWPFSTMGWPQRTPELAKFHPTSVLVTGFDILFFWVARMVMLGLKFMNDVPFHEVYIHALVRDMDGQKMSKSKGNVIDPVIMVDKYGADAFRFTLAILAAQGRDVKLNEDRIEGYRHFANKIWNAARFVLGAIEGAQPPIETVSESAGESAGENANGFDSVQFDVADRWILSRLNRLIEAERTALQVYKFNDAAASIYQFFWHEFCDWYIELVKPRLYGDDESKKRTAQLVLAHVLEKSLRLLHPFMPFIAEELWQQMPHEGESVCVAPYPEAQERWFDDEVEEKMGALMGVVSGIRNIRSEYNVKPSEILKGGVTIVVPTADITITTFAPEVINSVADHIKTLARVDHIKVSEERPQGKKNATAVVGPAEIFVPLEDLVNLDDEIDRLAKELKKVDKEVAGLDRKLGNQEFLSKAPPKIIEKNQARLDLFLAQQSKLTKNLADLQAAGSP